MYVHEFEYRTLIYALTLTCMLRYLNQKLLNSAYTAHGEYLTSQGVEAEHRRRTTTSEKLEINMYLEDD